MAARAIPTVLRSRSSAARSSCAHLLITVRHRWARVAALAITPLMLGSCAEMVEFRTDIARLRSDLQANTQTLSQLSARVDGLERRQADAESATQQTQQDLSQAIEILLRRALVMEDRQSNREAGRAQANYEAPESRAHHPPAVPPATSLPGSNFHAGRKQISLGMTQDDVRRLLGDPLSIEPVGDYVFWHYSPVSNQQYVIFEKLSGQVSGWRGL